ncbi:hypothetical protein [Methylorubrum populi]|uniref:hypothetical protein n=1 Tax=Methylorubrum populi TaxID=223967 RepID=UPI000DB26DDB|nr:hypothetical protein [Methylorubrum populi]PZP68377.1 MAG: hypothetical protein DI590_16645 [Methylorubrum populi]
MDTTVAPVPLRRHTEEGVKPAMAGQRPASTPVSAVVASQGLRPVDPGTRPRMRPLPSVLGVKLSADLRARIAAAAKADGITDSAWLRQRALEALGVESAVDAASGPRPRIPPAELEALSGVVREIGALHGPASLGKAKEVLDGLDRVRAVLIPLIIGLNGRSA